MVQLTFGGYDNLKCSKHVHDIIRKERKKERCTHTLNKHV